MRNEGGRWGGKKLAIILGAIVLGFVVFRMMTMEAELSLFKTVELPEFSELPNLVEKAKISKEKFAVAVDGEIAYEKDGDTVQPTASTAKMILGLMIMERKPFSLGEKGETVTITRGMYDRYAWYTRNNGTTTRVEEGEEISEYDALVAVFLASSNNMADSLAVWAFGSLDEYKEYATERLREWGLSKTVIGVDASGFDSSSASTAEELAKIGELVLKNPVLAEIVNMKKAEIPIAGEISNTNYALGVNRIAGVKTGWIGDASGYCLVSGYFEGEHRVTMAVLGADRRIDSVLETLEAADRLQGALKLSEVLNENGEVGYYDSWWTGRVPVRVLQKVEVLGWKGVESDISLSDEELFVKVGSQEYRVSVGTEEFSRKPSIFERFLHVFGWKK